MTLVRKQVQVTAKQDEFLKQQTEEREGVSEAFIIREALDMYIQSKKQKKGAD